MQETRKSYPCDHSRGTSRLGLHENVLAVITGQNGEIKQVIRGKNIITNGGDLYYAEKAVGDTPTNDFESGGIRLGTGTTTPAKADTDVTTFLTSASKAVASGYPKVNDLDANNSGKGTDIVTWKFVWSAADFTGTGIIEGAIVDNIATPTASLCHFLFAAAFNVIATDVLTLFVNHEFLGA